MIPVVLPCWFHQVEALCVSVFNKNAFFLLPKPLLYHHIAADSVNSQIPLALEFVTCADLADKCVAMCYIVCATYYVLHIATMCHYVPTCIAMC